MDVHVHLGQRFATLLYPDSCGHAELVSHTQHLAMSYRDDLTIKTNKAKFWLI